MVAMPPTIRQFNSDFVILAINGRTSKGASVCPINILADAERLSEPESLMDLAIIQAKPKTTFCKMPK
jgi:hypothetical protein